MAAETANIVESNISASEFVVKIAGCGEYTVQEVEGRFRVVSPIVPGTSRAILAIACHAAAEEFARHRAKRVKEPAWPRQMKLIFE